MALLVSQHIWDFLHSVFFSTHAVSFVMSLSNRVLEQDCSVKGWYRTGGYSLPHTKGFRGASKKNVRSGRTVQTLMQAPQPFFVSVLLLWLCWQEHGCFFLLDHGKLQFIQNSCVQMHIHTHTHTHTVYPMTTHFVFRIFVENILSKNYKTGLL